MFSPFPFLFVLIPTVHPQIHLFIPSQQNPVNKKGHFTGTHLFEDMKKHPLPPTLLFRLIQFQLLWWSRPLLIVVSFTPELKIMQIFGRRSVPSSFRLRQDSSIHIAFHPRLSRLFDGINFICTQLNSVTRRAQRKKKRRRAGVKRKTLEKCHSSEDYLR